MHRPYGLILVGFSLLGACAPTTKDDSATVPVDYASPGVWHPARHSATVVDATRDRSLTIETWYPAESGAGETPILDFIVNARDRATYEALLAGAPAGCPSTTSAATLDATVAAGGPWPVIVMSHCHGCTRFSTSAVAERLASHGFVVVAPEHAGNTLFDELAGTGLPLDTDTLALRAADLAFALDATLDGGLVAGLPVDASRIGAYGHSFGAVTAGVLIQGRLAAGQSVSAGLFVGAPPDNPLLPGVTAEALDVPVLFELLAEDHSIGAAGNLLIEGNYEAVPGPAWRVDLADAGHWSPSDLVGITADFMPGCGDDTRDPGGEPFSYLPAGDGRALSSAVASAFFAFTLNGNRAGEDWLAAPDEPRLTVQSR